MNKSYTITFADGTDYQGGPPNDSKWASQPLKPISRLVYPINEKSVCMEGFEAYNHIVERTQVMIGAKGQTKITKVIIMGKWKNEVMSVVFDYVKGTVSQTRSLEGEEYKGKPVTGWKEGLKDQKEGENGQRPKIRMI